MMTKNVLEGLFNSKYFDYEFNNLNIYFNLKNLIVNI